MEHNYAIENHTAERYLFQELSEEERDAYEEHFFSCSACAEEVKIASDFLESAKRVVQNELKAQLYGHVAHRSLWGSWLNWRTMLHPLPAAACLLLVFLSGFMIYQNRMAIFESRQTISSSGPVQGVTVAQIQKSQSYPVSEARRGPKTQINVSKGEVFVLQFDVPPQMLNLYESYQADIEAPSGVIKLSFKISKQEASNPVQVPVISGTLEHGEYEVVLQGVNSNGPESRVKGNPVHLPFELNVKD